MPILYDLEYKDYISLQDILQTKKTIGADIDRALHLIADHDSNGLSLWRKFYLHLKLFVDVFKPIYDHDNHQNHTSSLIQKRQSVLRTADYFFSNNIIDNQLASNYLQVQVYSFMVQACRYADIPQRSIDYQELLAIALQNLQMERLINHIDATTDNVMQLRCSSGKPRDALADSIVAKYASFKDLFVDMKIELELLMQQEDESYNATPYNSDNDDNSGLSSVNAIAENDRATEELSPIKRNSSNIALAFCKLARGFRKIDCLDDAIMCLRKAWRLQNFSNTYVIQLAITMQKKATPDSMQEAILLLQLQFARSERALTNAERFNVPYYLTILYCQSAHHHINNNEMDAALDCLLGGQTSILSAERSLLSLENTESTAEFKLSVAKSYHNLLAKTLKLLTTQDLGEEHVNSRSLNPSGSSEISDHHKQRLNAKYRFFNSLDPNNLPENIFNFTNSSICF